MTFLHSTVAFLCRRCPRCGRGRVYRTLFEMYPDCPGCGLHFEREPGYFVGSMYISYFFATVILGLFTVVGWLLWPDLDLGWTVLGAIAIFIPLVPITTQYSRILWMYLDRLIWPPSESSEAGPV
jgi:uncharacterized protein (DUF983 family)